MLPQDLDYAGVRLRLISSRLADDEHENNHEHKHRHDHEHKGHGRRHGRRGEHGHHKHARSDLESEPVIVHEDTHRPTKIHRNLDEPVFRKNEAATNFELFFDLWFVANLNVFTTVHEIFGGAELSSFIGYIVLLWTTWLMVTIYDVRYTSDSVFERVCRAIHLGVMVGFAEFGTSFDPKNQIKAIFQTLSLFLAISRFTLAVQYGVVAYQIRKYTYGKRPMITTASLHLIAAAVYFGISFRYDDGRNSRVYIMWYITGIIETILHLSFSNLSQVLSFVGTHFGERLNLLTLIILGEGCIILAKNITLLVKDTYLKDVDAIWSNTLIGGVISAAALIYIIFQIYFDWLHDAHHNHGSMYEAHQVWWASIHSPFHVALILFLEGVMQFVTYARILENFQSSIQKLEDAAAYLKDSPTSKEVSDALGSIIYPFLQKYPPPDILEAYKSVNETLAHISEIDDDFWNDTNEDSSVFVEWENDVTELYSTMMNAIFYAFGVEQPEEESSPSGHPDHIARQTTEAISARYELIFIYCFACAGIVLLFLTIMHALSKNKGWTPFNILRTAICLVIAIGLSLTCIITTNPAARVAFMSSPWMLPTITICYFAVLVLTHLPHPKFGLGKYATKDEYRGMNEHTKPRELLPTRKNAAAIAGGDGGPRERVYSRSRGSSDYDEESDDEDDDDHRENPHRSLRRAQRRERTNSMRFKEKDRSAHHQHQRTDTHLSDEAHHPMMSPSPSPPASPPPTNLPARGPSQRRDYH